MRVRIRHLTRYVYDGPTALGPQVIRLRPAEHAAAKVLTYNLDVQPAGDLKWQQDPWGNRIARLTYPAGREVNELQVTVDAAFDVRPVNPFDFFIDDRAREVPFAYPDGLDSELAPFLRVPTLGPVTTAWLETLPLSGLTIDYVVALNRKVAQDVGYIIREDPGIQTPDETLTRARGSCRDSALLLTHALRARGLAARFVSGYLIQLTDEGNIPDLAKGVSADVVDLHAWCEVYLPGAGWIGLDGTSGLLTGEGHIPLATAVHPELAAPVVGTASRPASGFEFAMEIERLGHEIRPSAPYTPEQWEALLAAGDAVDASLAAGGIELTMGGEPTWTSREHPAEPEWNLEALGPTKWSQGLRMAKELRARLGSGSLVMQRLGKHYPGESLPRWVLHQLWRTDGVPVWRDPQWLDFHDARAQAPATADDARRFTQALARRLDVAPELVPGYEDPWVAIIEEMNLPEDVDPLQADLSDPERRRTLARLLGQGLQTVVGYALPLQRGLTRWRTERWSFRRVHMFLLFGDAPMGLRLPLDRLGGTPMHVGIHDITALSGPLAFRHGPRFQGEAAASGPLGQGQEAAGAGHDGAAREAAALGRAALEPGAPLLRIAADERVHTALCVEPRQGVLHVFLPPLPDSEAFLELIAAVEDTAAELAQPVRVEGYPPPSDPRLQHCMVTPDPGVIEVNVPVTASMPEYVAMMATVHEAANHAGLTARKFQIDGREVGTGGGNHITFGGRTTVDSPFLRDPRLLGSLIRYVQNHPSLSYLFSGLFVGPTSQAPRIDEARHDSLYELEVALLRVTDPADPPRPWYVDRLLRHLLVDITGNTHRAELSIDKLYDPASLHGRQGIVELRAFEMPPHERMAVAQMLLMRGLIAALAAKPYTRPLVRWGSQLHDRFLLPHFLWRDLEDVLADVRAAGVPLEDEWYRPFLEFRCPVMGAITHDDVTVELRMALEPWPVLGEEPAGSVVSRYVDSSLDRVQVRVDGALDGRHVVTVNGYALPLRPTGRAREQVCGVRFRAWQPPSCLHPHIGIHHPLHFDVIDTWARRSLGACSYHVWHPDGRSYDEPPLTAFEAAARRSARFTTRGHATYPAQVIRVDAPDEQPFTLDLRRVDDGRPQPV